MVEITNKKSFWFSTTFILILVIVGFALLLFSTFWGKVLTSEKVEGTELTVVISEKSKKSEMAEKLGEVLLIIGLFHGFFEFMVKPKLFEEIADHTTKTFESDFIEAFKEESLKKELFCFLSDRMIGNEKIISSGLIDFEQSSKDVSYKETILTSDKLIIGLNHSHRLLDDNFDSLVARTKSGKDTTFLIMKIDSDGGTYEKSHYDFADSIDSRISRIKETLETIESNNPRDSRAIELIEHKVVLRYSFVYCETYIWVKPYRSSKGRTTIPAFSVKSGSLLYSFYESDILSLKEYGEVVNQQKNKS